MIKTRDDPPFSPSTMQSPSSNERNRPLSRIALQTRQLFRLNTQRAAALFSKPSFSRFKRKSNPPSPRSPSPSDSRLSLDDDILPTYESLTMHPESTRSISRAPSQTMMVENYHWTTAHTFVTIPIIPGYCF